MQIGIRSSDGINKNIHKSFSDPATALFQNYFHLFSPKWSVMVIDRFGLIRQIMRSETGILAFEMCKERLGVL